MCVYVCVCVCVCVCVWEGGWQGGFKYASYKEKGDSLKAYMVVEEGEGVPKFRTELRKYFIEHPSC